MSTEGRLRPTCSNHILLEVLVNLLLFDVALRDQTIFLQARRLGLLLQILHEHGQLLVQERLISLEAQQVLAGLANRSLDAVLGINLLHIDELLLEFIAILNDIAANEARHFFLLRWSHALLQ